MIHEKELEERVKSALNIDFSKIPVDIDILSFGEKHDNDDIRRFLSSNAATLRNAGFSTYGAEASTNGKSEFDLISKSRGSYVAPEATEFGPNRSPTYRDLVYSLAREGISVFPFDPRPSDPSLSKEKSEEDMAKIIGDNVREKGKGLVLVGDHHVQRDYGKLIDHLERNGYKCLNVYFCGGNSEGEHIVEVAARKAGRSLGAFMLDNRDHKIPPGHDYIVHLPQNGIISSLSGGMYNQLSSPIFSFLGK